MSSCCGPRLQREPSDTRALFYLARTCKDLGRWFDAIEAYERYLAAGGWRDERWQACYDLALCWRELGEWDHARGACRRALAIDPRRAEVAGLIGRLHYEARVAGGGRVSESGCGATIPEDVILFLDPREYREIPADFLALSLHHLGEHEEAVRWGELAVAWSGRSGTDRLRDNAWWYRRRRAAVVVLRPRSDTGAGSGLDVGPCGCGRRGDDVHRAAQGVTGPRSGMLRLRKVRDRSMWSMGCGSCRGNAWRNTVTWIRTSW